jgi:RecA-family ATPase
MREISAIYGDGGLGKSRLVLQLALKIAAGLRDFMGFKVEKKLPVLGVFCEDDKQEIHRRIYDIRKNADYEFLDDTIPFFVAPRAGGSSILGIQEGNIVRPGPFYGPLIDMIKQVGKGEDMVLITDTVSDIFAINENDRQAVSFCIKALLGNLAKKYKCTVLVIAHPSKTSQRDKIYDSGSTAWRNSIRNMLVMDKHDNPNLKDYRMLLHTKSNYAACVNPVLLQWQRGCFVAVEEHNIVDDITEKNTVVLLALITDMCKQGTPLGVHHNKHPNLYRVAVDDAAGGKKMSKETKTKILDALICDGIVEEVKGRGKSSENGLWPIILLRKEEEK